MSEIRRIDQEEYAAEALELLNQEREGFVRSACHSLSEGVSSEADPAAEVEQLCGHRHHTGDCPEYGVGVPHHVPPFSRMGEGAPGFRPLRAVFLHDRGVPAYLGGRIRLS